MQEVRQENDIRNTESKILQAAEHEFLTKGFIGARTTSIAEAAGVTHAMLHYYFRTKENLFDRIIADKISIFKNVLYDTIVSHGLSLEEKIKKIIDRHLDFVSANPDLPRFLVGEVFYNPQRLSTILDKIQSYAPVLVSDLQRQIDDAAAKGIYRKVDAKMLIIDIISLNIFSYMATPMINAILDNCMKDVDAFKAQRKRENFDMIMRKLKPGT